MSGHIGERAVVIGAGIGGLTAARALAGHFREIVVLERDVLPDEAADRPGTPQSRHAHGLLGGGYRALRQLFPDFETDMAAAGGVTIRAGLDVRLEQPGFDPFPRRDLGWRTRVLSRAGLERAVRRRLKAIAHVTIHDGARVEALTASADGSAVTGVRIEAADGAATSLAAELVIDASGAGLPTLDFLERTGRGAPEETVIAIDLGYSTAVFAKPADASNDWRMLVTAGQPPGDCHAAGVFALEGDRWMVTLVGRGGDRPPGDWEGFMAFARGLRSPTLYEAIKDAERLGEVVRFRFTANVNRHFERLGDFPRGLVPFGDAICRFNPAYGQGMSVAAMEACLLDRLLSEGAHEDDPLDGLAADFLAGAQALIETPWNMVAALDFQFAETRGERPANFEMTTRFGQAFVRLAAEDPAVHRLWQDVWHLLEPASAYADPALIARVLAKMADA